MLPGDVVVMDVGKTLTKMSLFTAEARLLAQRSYKNRLVVADGRRWLDTDGIDRWARTTLHEFAHLGSLAAIVPVGHGAAAALVRGDALACPVPDYEDPIDPAIRAAYDTQRDGFHATGSPALPGVLISAHSSTDCSANDRESGQTALPSFPGRSSGRGSSVELRPRR